MNIRQWQQINLIPTGNTYEYEMSKLFNLDINRSIEDVRKDINKIIEIKEYKLKNKVIFHNKTWKWETDLIESTFEQWIRLDQLLAEEDNIKNLHKLLAIYFRPCWKGKIHKYNLNEQDKVSEELLDLDVNIATALMVFFYHLVALSMNFIKIPFLKQKMKEEKKKPHIHMENKWMSSSNTSIGI